MLSGAEDITSAPAVVTALSAELAEENQGAVKTKLILHTYSG